VAIRDHKINPLGTPIAREGERLARVIGDGDDRQDGFPRDVLFL
jgi:hypothetical protein